MNRNALLIISGLVIAGFVVALVLLQQNQTVDSPESNLNSTNSNLLSFPVETPEPPKREGPSITRALVELNNTIESCYVIYGEYVYLIPKTWADEHEGGSDAITDACGNDITDLFDNNEEHTFDAATMLDSFYLGNLTN